MDRLCYRHDDRLAAKLCDWCGRPLCAECVMREQTGFDVCSFACADRLNVRAEEEKKGEELDPWPTRIWTSLFLFVFLTVVGGFAGGFVAFGMVGRQRRYHANNLVIDHFPELLKGLVIGGAILGAVSAVVFLFRYYRRKF